MSQEAIVVCIDNTEFGRNGDFTPSRIASQVDAANVICGTKIQQNPESHVAILLMSEERFTVLSALSREVGKLLSAMSKVKSQGDRTSVVRAAKTSILILRHRPNKNMIQRCVLFVSGQVTDSESELEAVGKQLRKQGICVDVVLMRNDPQGEKVLGKLVAAANGDSGASGQDGFSTMQSRLLLVPSVSEASNLVDCLPQTSVLGGMARSSHGGDDDMGIDESLDPELAAAIKMSLEEEAQRTASKSGTGSSSPKDTEMS